MAPGDNYSQVASLHRIGEDYVRRSRPADVGREPCHLAYGEGQSGAAGPTVTAWLKAAVNSATSPMPRALSVPGLLFSLTDDTVGLLGRAAFPLCWRRCRPPRRGR